MNEQLSVKNFGPIKDATVDFKKVTVFIGPTGGGKSTLAKLAAVFRDSSYSSQVTNSSIRDACFNDYLLNSHKKIDSEVFYKDQDQLKILSFEQGSVLVSLSDKIYSVHKSKIYEASSIIKTTKSLLDKAKIEDDEIRRKALLDQVEDLIKRAEDNHSFTRKDIMEKGYNISVLYAPSDRSFVASIMSSWPGLMRDDIGLPKTLLKFSNIFFQARDKINDISIPFLGVQYFRHDKKDYISYSNEESAIHLYEAASGIQSVTPLLVLLEHLSRNTEQAQSFIIEEPELNLYPTAQQGLLNWLVEKCTTGENDLTITTHSPYILSHLNLLLYAYQVAEKHPDRAEDVAKIVPRASWINPQEFACYQVENGGVQSLVNAELGLIDNNELDALSGDAADAFDNLIRLSKGVAVR
ncbi:AAA family ATPase [Hymenobacter sp. J193]|uniref:AAA family ATPase n=1 Tax=Hymenobacter sp. J193 TaxID=2898429 RepID=UPI002151AB7F|nr:AAA family ATPase [Hymenobacter sp. J193]MCR5888533.1 AAA family ATPase [Hymenobacter sp. J193]